MEGFTLTWDIKQYGVPIDTQLRKHIIQSANEIYSKLSGDPNTKLHLILISNSKAKQKYQNEITKKIAEEYKLKTAPFNLNASITHHAFFGIPNIVVKLNQILKEDTNWLAELQIAVSHAILHGAPKYYIISINPAFRKLEYLHNYQRIVLSTAYYLLATAVKSFEVTRLLGMNQYITDQLRLLEKSMRISPDEEKLWKSSDQNINAKLLLFSNTLKGLAPYGALRFFIQEPPPSLIGLYKANLGLMGEPYRSLTDKILNDSFPRLGYDTLDNITFITSIISKTLE